MALGITPQQIIEKDKNPLLRIDKDWQRVMLKDISDVQNGYAFSSKHFNREKGLPLIRIRDIRRIETENLYSGEFDEAFVVNHNDILIGMDGDFRASKWPGKKGLLNQRVCRLLFDSDYYNVEFFFLCLQPYLDAIHEETSSVTVKHLSSNTIKQIPLPLPPLPIQRAIVTKIENLFASLDKGIADLKKAQEQLKIYRQAVLKKAFEGELTKTWREERALSGAEVPTAEELLEQIKQERQKYYEQQLEDWKQAVKTWEENGKEGKKPSKPKKMAKIQNISISEFINSDTIPQRWLCLNLEAISTKISDGPFGSNLKTSDYVDKGIQVIRLENIKNRYFDNSKKSFVTQEKYQTISQHTVFPNDIIFSTFIADETKVARVPSTIEYAINKADCLCVRPMYEPSVKYIEFYLSTRQTYLQLENKVHGATRPRINSTQLKELPILFCSLEEQHQIVREIESRLSVCDKVEQNITEALEKSEALRQSILKKAFEGKLLSEAEIEKCKQEADYEPASTLLHRIERSRNERIKGIEVEKPQKKPAKQKTEKKKAATPKISKDIQAGVIAKVIKLHEDNPKYLNTLSYIKCEKISHLVDYHLQIQLGRKPAKDAAGPDDFNHLVKVEHRARMTGYFKTTNCYIEGWGKGRTYQSDRNINKAIDNLEKKISEEQTEQLNKLIGLFLKFDLERAEIVATVYAGWNNLLIDGKTPTDDEIVYESCENWSKRKLNIERERFYKALTWMRKPEVALIPKGTGLRVNKPEKKK